MIEHPDFLSEQDKVLPHHVQPKPRRRYFLRGVILVGVVCAAYAVGVISSGESLSRAFGDISLWDQFKRLISSDDKKLAGEDIDRINVLLIGVGGENHDGPDLADTMILASLRPSDKQVAFISIPRDLLVPIPGHGWRKINHANAFGEQNDGKGGELASTVVSEVFGMPVHYYARIDFNGFEKIIDDLGGITVNVEAALDDERYPVIGKETATTSERYMHLYVPAGQVRMDGDLALKYVRSRTAKGSEGSDFGRSRRQQRVLIAVKEKFLSLSTLGNPFRINAVMDDLGTSITTNLEGWEALRLLSLAKDVEEKNIRRRVFDDRSGSPLYSSITSEGAYVLQPKSGDFSELTAIASSIFDTPTPESLTTATPQRVEIQNGTKIEGLAYRTSTYLQHQGYEIVRLSNAPTQDYQKTVIYQLRKTNEVSAASSALAELLGADVAPALPGWLLSTTTPRISSQSDILVIVGQDHKEL